MLTVRKKKDEQSSIVSRPSFKTLIFRQNPISVRHHRDGQEPSLPLLEPSLVRFIYVGLKFRLILPQIPRFSLEFNF